MKYLFFTGKNDLSEVNCFDINIEYKRKNENYMKYQESYCFYYEYKIKQIFLFVQFMV